MTGNCTDRPRPGFTRDKIRRVLSISLYMYPDVLWVAVISLPIMISVNFDSGSAGACATPRNASSSEGCYRHAEFREELGAVLTCLVWVKFGDGSRDWLQVIVNR